MIVVELLQWINGELQFTNHGFCTGFLLHLTVTPKNLAATWSTVLSTSLWVAVFNAFRVLVTLDSLDWISSGSLCFFNLNLLCFNSGSIRDNLFWKMESIALELVEYRSISTWKVSVRFMTSLMSSNINLQIILNTLHSNLVKERVDSIVV